MAAVVWEPEALAQIASIRSYARQFNAPAADRLVQRLVRAGNSLDRLADRGRPCSDGTREMVTVAPYVIRYLVHGEMVHILTIRHARQRQTGR